MHVDVDVLDPAVMPAVDAPEPGGIAFAELELLLAGLVSTPHCLGVEITVFDPDYDPDGAYAAELVAALSAGLSTSEPRLGGPRRDRPARSRRCRRCRRCPPAPQIAARPAGPRRAGATGRSAQAGGATGRPAPRARGASRAERAVPAERRSGPSVLARPSPERAERRSGRPRPGTRRTAGKATRASAAAGGDSRSARSTTPPGQAGCVGRAGRPLPAARCRARWRRRRGRRPRRGRARPSAPERGALRVTTSRKLSTATGSRGQFP